MILTKIVKSGNNDKDIARIKEFLAAISTTKITIKILQGRLVQLYKTRYVA